MVFYASIRNGLLCLQKSDLRIYVVPNPGSRLLDLGSRAIRISFFSDWTSVREYDLYYVEEVDL